MYLCCRNSFSRLSPWFLAVCRLIPIIYVCFYTFSAQAECRVDGDGPLCGGECRSDEIEIGRSKGNWGAEFIAVGPDGEPLELRTGSLCLFGSKAMCCTRCPKGLVWRNKEGNKLDTVCVTPEERDGKSTTYATCIVGGVARTDIAPSDCKEAQTTGCIRSKLSPQAYTNCIAAQNPIRRLGKLCIIGGVVRKDILTASDCVEAKTTGCIKRELSARQYANCLAAQPPKATALAPNTVYKEPNGDTGIANTVCAMSQGDKGTVAKLGPDKWVFLDGISGACMGRSGWLWNDGELQLP